MLTYADVKKVEASEEGVKKMLKEATYADGR